MKAKPLFVAIAALLAAGGLWLAWLGWRAHESQKSSTGVGVKTAHSPNVDRNSAASLPKASQPGPAGGDDKGPKPGQRLNPPARLAPPDPNRRFTDFTPEQRVQFARKGHGPGG